MGAKTYKVYNGPMVTTAAPVPVTTGTAVKTMLQIAPGVPIRVIEWGFSLSSYTVTPAIVELIDTSTVFATVTAFAVADVAPDNDPNAPANTAGSSGLPLNLGTALSGYTASAEGTITATRLGDVQQDPQGPYVKQEPLGREFEIPAGHALRIRATFNTAANMLCYVRFEV
jgi:hypothetical protein